MAPSNTQSNANEELLTSSAATTNQSQSVVEGSSSSSPPVSSSSSGSQAVPSLANIFDLSTPAPTLTALQRRKHDQHCSTNVLPKDENPALPCASASSVKPVMQFKFAADITGGNTSQDAISKAVGTLLVGTQEANKSTSANTSNSSTQIERSTAEEILLNEPEEPLGLSLELVEKCMIYALTLLSENDRLEPTEALVAVIRSVGALVGVREYEEEGGGEDKDEDKDEKDSKNSGKKWNYLANVRLLPEFEESPGAIAEAAQKVVFNRNSDDRLGGGKRWRREEEGKQEASGQEIANLDGADGAVHELLCALRESLANVSSGTGGQTSMGLRRIVNEGNHTIQYNNGAKPTPRDIAKALNYAVTQTQGSTQGSTHGSAETESAETESRKVKPPLLICALRDYIAVSGVRETEGKFEGETEVEVGAHLVLVMGTSGVSEAGGVAVGGVGKAGGDVVGKVGTSSSRTSFVVFDPFDIRAEVWNGDELAKMDIDSVWDVVMG
jgi:hypothetical protein